MKTNCFDHLIMFQMSKSLKNVVDPMAVKKRHGADLLRYVLLSRGTPFSDGSKCAAKYSKFYNKEHIFLKI